jgi:hypothetical protein
MPNEEAPEWAKALIGSMAFLTEQVAGIDKRLAEVEFQNRAPAEVPDIPDDEPLPPPPPRTGPPPCTHQHQKLVKGVVTCAMCDKPLVQSGVVESSLTNQRPFDPRTVTQGTTDYKAD